MPNIQLRATKKIGRYNPGDLIEFSDKYAARSLVALGKAEFVNESDEFRRVAPRRGKRKRTYARRDMTPESESE